MTNKPDDNNGSKSVNQNKVDLLKRKNKQALIGGGKEKIEIQHKKRKINSQGKN